MALAAADLTALEAAFAGLGSGRHGLTVLTGAGVSTESGVPDFRSSESPWKRYPPIGFAAWLSDPVIRVEAWRRKFAMDETYKGAEPGPSHIALATMAERDLIRTLITQNIDGLHQAAGFPAARLVELHGNGTFARCLTCGRRIELAEVRRHLDATGEAPVCSCGGLVKSATVAFGQSLDPALLDAAVRAAGDCKVFLAIGSSLVVRPAAHLPVLAKTNGATLVIVNREPTALDAVADLTLRAEAGDVLTALACWH